MLYTTVFFSFFIKFLVLSAKFVFCFVVAGLTQPLFEWAIHKYILHPLGTKKGSFFHYHWEHHNRCRKNNNVDQEYVDLFNFKFSSMVKKEICLMLGANLFLSLPVAMLINWPAGICMMLWQWIYFFIHAASHVTPYVENQFEVGKLAIPWHGEHHMGPNQNMNWGVTDDWPDRLLKTSTLPSIPWKKF